MAMRIAGEIGAKDISRTTSKKAMPRRMPNSPNSKRNCCKRSKNSCGKRPTWPALRETSWPPTCNRGRMPTNGDWSRRPRGNSLSALPANEKLLAEIDIANLWIEQADRKQHLLLQAGFSIPKALDPLHQKALLRLYELQAGLSDDSGTLANIRQILAERRHPLQSPGILRRGRSGDSNQSRENRRRRPKIRRVPTSDAANRAGPAGVQ